MSAGRRVGDVASYLTLLDSLGAQGEWRRGIVSMLELEHGEIDGSRIEAWTSTGL